MKHFLNVIDLTREELTALLTESVRLKAAHARNVPIRSLAGKVLNDGGLTPEAQVDRAYRMTFSRAPSAAERKTALDFLSRQSVILADRMATDTKTPLPDNLPEGVEKVRAAALVDLCHALLNSNEFVYLN